MSVDRLEDTFGMNHPPKKPEDSSEQTYTERSLTRKREDSNSVSVILKRSDETKRHPDDILEKAIVEGLEQTDRPALSLFLSSLAAGLILSHTVMAVGVAASLSASLTSNPAVMRLLTALVYPSGFIICIMSGTQLFTEHTATAVYPVLEGRSGLRGLFRLWAIVLIGNLVGALVSAVLLSVADPMIQAKTGYLIIADHLVGHSVIELVLSAISAGWLMAIGGWLVVAAPPAISQIVCIFIVTFLIGLGGLNHSIAGAVEMFTGYLISDKYAMIQVLRFVFFSIIGNLIGGSFFVAILNYAHIRKTQEIEK